MLRGTAKRIISLIMAAVLFGGVMILAACRGERYPGALRIGVTEIPKTLMPYASIDSTNTFVAGYLYDTLLSGVSVPNGYQEGEEFSFDNGEVYQPVDNKANYFMFSDGLVGAEGAYPKQSSDGYGWETYTPTVEQYNQQLQTKKIVKGVDQIGNPYAETDEQFAARAEAAVPSDNWMRYRFRIVAGHSWSDGQDFSAADIVFTFDYILRNEGALASQAFFLSNYFDSFEQNGDFVLELATNKLSDIKAICSAISILPQHIWQDIRRPAQEKNINPVGTGPYTVKEGSYIADISLTLSLRDNYNPDLLAKMFAGEPIKDITLVALASEEVKINSLEQGSIDVIHGAIEPVRAAAIRDNARYKSVKVADFESPYVTTLVFNQGKKGVFADGGLNGNAKAVRQAMSLAVDQQDLINKVLNGGGVKVGDGLVQSFHPHSLVDGDGNYIEHITNIEQAKQLLDGAGYTADASGKRGLKFSVLAVKPNEGLVYALKAQMEKIGVELEFQLATSEYSEKVKQGNGADFDLIINTVIFSLDTLLMFDARFGVYPNGGIRIWNYSGVNNPELTQLMLDMDTETDILKQIIAAQRVQEKIAGLYAEIPLYAAKSYSVYNESRYKGWVSLKDGGVINQYSIRYLTKV